MTEIIPSNYSYKIIAQRYTTSQTNPLVNLVLGHHNRVFSKAQIIPFISYNNVKRLHNFFFRKNIYSIYIFKQVSFNFSFFFFFLKKNFIPRVLWQSILLAYSELFMFFNLKLFERVVTQLFGYTRIDKHGRIFRFVLNLCKIFPQTSSNLVSLSVKIKGKMSRKGTARTRTLNYVRFFNHPTSTVLEKNNVFLLSSATGCTGFFYSIRYNR